MAPPYFVFLVPQVPSDGSLLPLCPLDYSPALGQLTRGLGKKCFPLGMISLLLGYSSGPPSHVTQLSGVGPTALFLPLTKGLKSF